MADPSDPIDPFGALHSPIVPTEPDPAFAAGLRRRIEQAIEQPGEATASDTGTGARDAAEDAPARGPRHGDVGYVSLWVPDAERAAAFFTAALGWQYSSGRPSGSRQVRGSAPVHGLLGNQARATLFLCFTVEDVDEATERVRDASGEVAEPPRDTPSGRIADCVDDQGTPFAVVAVPVGGDGIGTTRTRGTPNGTHQGDLAYITMEVVDSVRARAFYGSVLGWRFGPGSVPDGWGVDQVVPMVGLVGHQPRATIVPMYRVDDIGAAVERVRAAGGAASDPARQPYGVTSSCADDQGTRFWLGQLRSPSVRDHPPPNPE